MTNSRTKFFSVQMQHAVHIHMLENIFTAAADHMPLVLL